MEQTTELGVKTVLYGQPYRDAAGIDRIAEADFVILGILADGQTVAAAQMSAEEAMAAGHALADAAGRIVNAEIGDDGKPTGFLHRVARLSGKATS